MCFDDALREQAADAPFQGDAPTAAPQPRRDAGGERVPAAPSVAHSEVRENRPYAAFAAEHADHEVHVIGPVSDHGCAMAVRICTSCFVAALLIDPARLALSLHVSHRDDTDPQLADSRNSANCMNAVHADADPPDSDCPMCGQPFRHRAGAASPASLTSASEEANTGAPRDTTEDGHGR